MLENESLGGGFSLDTAEKELSKGFFSTDAIERERERKDEGHRKNLRRLRPSKKP